MADFIPEDNVRDPDFQELYDVLDIHPDDQPVYDTFRADLEDKVTKVWERLKALEQQRARDTADNRGSQSVTTDDVAAADVMNRNISYEIEEATDEDEEDLAATSTGSPPPNSWAKVKPGPEYGELHFPGHANYTDNEIPITGDHGFMLLHRRPRFKPVGRYTMSKDQQELDQAAMTTLHYVDNSELRVQRETFTREAVGDWRSESCVRKLEYWVKRFLLKHGANPRLRHTEQHAYIEAERDWIRRAFEREPDLRLGVLCKRFNAHWGGRVVPGVGKRPTRTNGALMNEVYRSDLKQLKVPGLRNRASSSQGGGVGGLEDGEDGQKVGEEKARDEKADGEYELDDEYLDDNGTGGSKGRDYEL